MITKRDRQTVIWMLWLRIWTLKPTWFGQPVIIARWGTRWILEGMLKRMERDDLHHAPACPANHFHYRRLVFQRCNCGALYYSQLEQQKAE